MWFLKNRRHRGDGPAVINTSTGSTEYWLDGAPTDKQGVDASRAWFEKYGQS